MVVNILTPNSFGAYYRFYGARHSILQLGYLIDFEIEQDRANFLPRLRNLSHIGFPWLYDNDKLLSWHRFISIFYPHFAGVEKVDDFYFNTLYQSAKKWSKQSPSRVAIESFVKILNFEGRLNNLDKCVMCNKAINGEVSLINKFLPAHPSCSKKAGIKKEKLEYLFKNFSTLLIEDNEIKDLIAIVYKGF
jgi:hypothetical protein